MIYWTDENWAKSLRLDRETFYYFFEERGIKAILVILLCFLSLHYIFSPGHAIREQSQVARYWAHVTFGKDISISTTLEIIGNCHIRTEVTVNC